MYEFLTDLKDKNFCVKLLEVEVGKVAVNER
jgi:hypothetical protein